MRGADALELPAQQPDGLRKVFHIALRSDHRITRRSSPRESVSRASASDTEKPSFARTRPEATFSSSVVAHLDGAECPDGELDEEGRELRANALAPERREHRVTNARHIGGRRMAADVAQADRLTIRSKGGHELMLA